MAGQFKKVTLTTIAGGAIDELFKKEFETVVNNIADINAPAKATRKITIEVVIKPTDDRDMGSVEVRCHSKIASTKPVAASMFFAKEGGKPVAYQNDPKQPDLFNENVVGMKGEPVNA